MIGKIILIILLAIVLASVLSSIKIVNTGNLYVVERFGQFYKVLEPGWHFTIPFADFVRKK
ncbi:paraslipin, partial [Bacteroidales bacterium MSK.15.36]|nr:paraslipin [Bacteroidales bacterium MSK.15.36]